MATDTNSSDSRPLRHLVIRRAVAMREAMLAAEREVRAEVADAQLKLARTLAADVMQAVDTHFRGGDLWDLKSAAPRPAGSRVSPLLAAERNARRATTEARRKAGRQCHACEHWYPDGSRELAEAGTCRRPANALRVQGHDKPWPDSDRDDTCSDWTRALSLHLASGD